MSSSSPLLAVVIPAYRVRAHVLSVLERIGPEVGMIYVVDDACPDESGRFVEENATDPRVRVRVWVSRPTLTSVHDAMADLLVRR